MLSKSPENKFVLVDELDSYLFDEPIEILQEEDGPVHSIRFKMRLLRPASAVGVLGVTGTLDKLYGVKALDLLFQTVSYVRAPTMRNQEAASNYRDGQQKSFYSADEEDFVENVVAGAKEYAAELPVIVITEDQKSAEAVFEQLGGRIDCPKELFLEPKKLGFVGLNDWEF